jgi:hypothetical protein
LHLPNWHDLKERLRTYGEKKCVVGRLLNACVFFTAQNLALLLGGDLGQSPTLMIVEQRDIYVFHLLHVNCNFQLKKTVLFYFIIKLFMFDL